jgi:hypothetical protein
MGRGVADAKQGRISDHFTLDTEFETTPFEAVHLNVDKGQTFRFELVQGTHILDNVLLDRYRALDDWASRYDTGAVQGPAPYEDYVLVWTPPVQLRQLPLY